MLFLHKKEKKSSKLRTYHPCGCIPKGVIVFAEQQKKIPKEKSIKSNMLLIAVGIKTSYCVCVCVCGLCH